jgi:hypothetical protein
MTARPSALALRAHAAGVLAGALLATSCSPGPPSASKQDAATSSPAVLAVSHSHCLKPSLLAAPFKLESAANNHLHVSVASEALRLRHQVEPGLDGRIPRGQTHIDVHVEWPITEIMLGRWMPPDRLSMVLEVGTLEPTPNTRWPDSVPAIKAYAGTRGEFYLSSDGELQCYDYFRRPGDDQINKVIRCLIRPSGADYLIRFDMPALGADRLPQTFKAIRDAVIGLHAPCA